MCGYGRPPRCHCDIEARFAGKAVIRRHADADDDEIDIKHRAVGEFGSGHPAFHADKAHKAGLFADGNAMGLMDAAHDIGGFFRRHALQNAVGHLDQGHLEAELAGDGGRFKADITAADHQQPAAGLHLLHQPVGVALVANRQDAFEITADAGGQQARCGPGCQDQPVIRKRAAILHAHGFFSAVYLLHPGGKPNIDIVFGVPFLRAEHQPVETHLTEKVFFG